MGLYIILLLGWELFDLSNCYLSHFRSPERASNLFIPFHCHCFIKLGRLSDIKLLDPVHWKLGLLRNNLRIDLHFADSAVLL